MISYERTITDAEQAILEHDLLDITDWINKAIEGKIHNCKARAAKEYRAKLTAENAESLPTSDDVAVAAYFAREDYQNRAEREAANVQ